MHTASQGVRRGGKKSSTYLLEPIELLLRKVVLLGILEKLGNELVLEDILELGVLRGLCFGHCGCLEGYWRGLGTSDLFVFSFSRKEEAGRSQLDSEWEMTRGVRRATAVSGCHARLASYEGEFFC